MEILQRKFFLLLINVTRNYLSAIFQLILLVSVPFKAYAKVIPHRVAGLILNN